MYIYMNIFYFVSVLTVFSLGNAFSQQFIWIMSHDFIKLPKIINYSVGGIQYKWVQPLCIYVLYHKSIVFFFLHMYARGSSSIENYVNNQMSRRKKRIQQILCCSSISDKNQLLHHFTIIWHLNCRHNSCLTASFNLALSSCSRFIEFYASNLLSSIFCSLSFAFNSNISLKRYLPNQ